MHRSSHGSPLTLLGLKLFQGCASPSPHFLSASPVLTLWEEQPKRENPTTPLFPLALARALSSHAEGSDPKSKAAQFRVSAVLLTL